MRSIDVFAFYTLGSEIRMLKETLGKNTIPFFELFLPLYGVETQVKALVSGNTIALDVAKIPAENLLQEIAKIEANHFVDENGKFIIPEDKKEFSSWEVSGLKGPLDRLEHVLAAELQTVATYYATKIGIYDTADLVERSHLVFPGGLLPFVSSKSVDEYKSAGRALAFDLATAAGFHVGRAVEAQLREYRSLFIQAAPGKTMGAMLRSLERYASTKSTPAPDEKTLRQLELFIKLDRNRIMHPEDTLSPQQAMICFGTGVNAISAMASEVKAIKGAVGQGNLPFQGKGTSQ